MRNQHLIPPSVSDIIDKLSAPLIRENEKMNYILRLEAIRDYCDLMIKKYNNEKNSFSDKSRKINRR